MYVGARRGVERRVMKDHAIPSSFIVARPLPTRRSLATVSALGALAVGCCQAWWLLRRTRPAAVFGTGGYASACVVYAAARLGIPTLIHDLDAAPGRASRRLARLATRVTVGYPEAAAALGRPDAVHTGNPIRREIGSASRAEGLTAFGLSDDRRTLLVLGGSQGARRLNDAVLAAANRLVGEMGLQLLHISGPSDWDRVREGVAALPPDILAHYHGRPYLEGTMHLALAAADLCLCRSGAGTVSELTAVGVPGIYVPYPYALGHQARNAEAVAKSGGGTVVQDAVLTGETLLAEVCALLEGNRMAQMGEAARACGRPGAADHIAAVLLEMAGEGCKHGRSGGAVRPLE